MTDSWVPLAAVGGIVLVATRAFQNAKEGDGIGLGGGSGGFGVNLWQFIFGAEGKGEEGGGDSGAGKDADGPGGTADKPGEDGEEGKDGGTSTGNGKDGQNDNNGDTSAGNGKDGEGGAGGEGGGVGGGSGGGIGSGSSSGPGEGQLDQGGSHGEDDGGGDDEGYYEYDPYQGVMIEVDLPLPDTSEQMLAAIRETARTLVNHAIYEPGASPEAAQKLPPELHSYDFEKGGDYLRFWADVTLHYHFDLPWGRLNDEQPSHFPWINLWIDILAYITVYESEETPWTFDDIPTTTAKKQDLAITTKVLRRGLGDTGVPLFPTRIVNPLFLRTMNI